MQGSVWAGNNGIGARPWGYKGINMKIAVCDDEKVQCTLLSDYLGDWGRGRGILTEVICFPSGESLLFAWEEEVFDLLILDIEMGGISGMALAEKIRKENEDIPILFVTGYDEYMAQGYEVAALHYLLKPVHREKLFEVLDGLQRRKKPEEKLPFPTSGGYILLPASQIWYVEAMGHDCLLCTAGEKSHIRTSIGEVLKMLGDKKEFVRCHRSYVVNLQHIGAIVRAEVVMDDGTRLPISRRVHKEVNEAFIRNYK